MPEKPTFEELKRRIEADLPHYQGAGLERAALAWSGYLGALIEWGLLSPGDHGRLFELLPHIEDDPVYFIMVGRPGPGES